MAKTDLNLLVTLDVLLAEGSVAKAAKRLRLSPSATSRALARLRTVVGDPLLVRAGRGLVPTPRAVELRERVSRTVQDAEALLRPAGKLDLGTLARVFRLRTSDGFVENFGSDLLARVSSEAPAARLHFVSKLDGDVAPLRDGSVDLETGVIRDTTSAELRVQSLFRDRFIGVARQGHPLANGDITPSRYAAARHVLVSRSGSDHVGIDEALEAIGLKRDIATRVGGFTAALALARDSDLVASVPARHTGNLREGLFSFQLPLRTPEFAVSLLWHPRFDGDAAHRWLRGCIRETCLGRPT